MNWIHDRIYVRNQSCNILICGAVGTGKSFTALRIAELLQPDFDVKKQVVYTKEQLSYLWLFVVQVFLRLIHNYYYIFTYI